MTAVLFFVFAALALAGALGVVLSKNPVYSALLLVVTLVSVAVFFLMQDAQLVAAVQIIVYASAIVVLFLFVIMLLGVDRPEPIIEPLPGQRVLALGLGAVLLAQLLFLGGRVWATGASCAEEACRPDAGGGNVEAVARTMFTTYLWPFEITAALLVIAVVGGLVVARRGGAVTDAEDEPEDDGGPEAAATEKTGETSRSEVQT